MEGSIEFGKRERDRTVARALLGTDLRAPYGTRKRHMRPYYEDMKRAYMKKRKTRRKTAPEPAEP